MTSPPRRDAKRTTPAPSTSTSGTRKVAKTGSTAAGAGARALKTAMVTGAVEEEQEEKEDDEMFVIAAVLNRRGRGASVEYFVEVGCVCGMWN
jgi:hypothetical protein